MAANTRKITISLPKDTVSNLDLIAEQLGASRSALLSVLLGEASFEMASAIRGSGIENGGGLSKRAVESNLIELHMDLEELQRHAATSH